MITEKSKEVWLIYKHAFVVDDVDALVERANGTKAIDENQEIIFYVPERQIAKFHYYLYCGLPTAIELGVPMAIDVPFELTASRDNVLQNAWNVKLKQEMYSAYTGVLKKIARKSRTHGTDLDGLHGIGHIIQPYGLDGQPVHAIPLVAGMDNGSGKGLPGFLAGTADVFLFSFISNRAACSNRIVKQPGKESPYSPLDLCGRKG